MNDHVDPGIAALLHRYWPIPRDVDHFEHFEREEALREQARERRLMAHPDPRDPEHPGDEDEH